MKFSATLMLMTLTAFGIRAASAQDLPKLKSGLWESTTTSSGPKGAPANTSKHSMCVDEKFNRDVMTFSQNMGAQCSKNTVRRDGNRVLGESECTMGNMTVKSQSVTTFSGDSSFRTENRATFTPPMAGMSESVTIQEGRHAGACPSNMKPGDINMHGRIMNINDMAKMMKGAGR